MKRLFQGNSLILILVIMFACSSATETVGKDTQEENEITTDKRLTEDFEENTEIDEKTSENVTPLYTINKANWTIEPIESGANEKVLLLTIDDAPDIYALEMAQTLKKLDVPAIFFVNGHFLLTEEKKQTLQEIYEMGFVIGNHTYSHESLANLDKDEQQEQILKVNEQVLEITGDKPVFFRAPFGQNTGFSKNLVENEEMIMMNWTYGYDWNEEYMTKDSLTDIMINAPELTNGSNLLLHDRKWTAEALEGIVEGLREKGYEFIDPKDIKGYES